MYASVSYSQRKGGPRNKYFMYFCRNRMSDKNNKHVSMNVDVANEAVAVRVLHRISQGDLTTFDNTKVKEALKAVAVRMAENEEELAHLGTILFNVKLKKYHKEAEGKVAALEAQRTQLEEERDALMAQRADGGALAEFVAAWQELPEESINAVDADLQKTVIHGYEAWKALSLEKQRDIIKGLFRLQVAAGGRGAERLQFSPIQLSA